MYTRRQKCLLAVALLAAVIQPHVQAATASVTTEPHPTAWALELKGGMFKPDLDDYSQFYGDDDVFLLSVAGAWQFRPWLEFGAEVGYSKDTGTGTLADADTVGGRVEYTLVPLQVYFNLRYDRSPDQLFVPYIGAGLVSAWYKQDISQQSSRSGFSDIGGAARAGLQLSLNRLNPRTRVYASGDRLIRSYLFIEGQYTSTKKDGNDLGGDSYQMGLRMEF